MHRAEPRGAPYFLAVGVRGGFYSPLLLTITRCFAFAVAVEIVLCAQSNAALGPPDVHVFSCQVVSGVIVPRPDDIGLFVRFRNDGNEPLKSIVWRVKYGKAAVDVFDDGTFTPNVRIDNFALAEQGSTHINLLAMAFDLGIGMFGVPPTASMTKSNLALPPYLSTADPQNCAILRATFANGDVWLNTALDQTSTMIGVPTPIPSPTTSASDAAASEPVRVTHCELVAGPITRLEVGFENTSQTVADRIVFRATYGSSGIDFADAGAFAPGSIVHHWLKHPKLDELQHQAYHSFDDPAGCSVVSVHGKDGSLWQNSAVPANADPLPTAVPDAMWMIPNKWQRHFFPTPAPSPPAPSS